MASVVHRKKSLPWPGCMELAQNTVELQWLEHLWDHQNKLETRVIPVRVDESARSGGIIKIPLIL